MDQSYHRPSHHLTGLPASSANSSFHQTLILRSTSPQTRSTSGAVAGKEESLLRSQQDDQKAGNHNEARPTKRRKVLEDGGRHKFVSQKRWKFLDGQPWLPSKVSSKAQNASKAVNKIKQEPTSPRPPLSPTIARSIDQSNRVHLSQSLMSGEGHMPLFRPAGLSRQSSDAASNAPDVIGKQRNEPELNIPAFELSSVPHQTRTFAEGKPWTRDTHEQGATIEKDLRSSAMTEPSRIASIDTGRSRLLRSGDALSLEKDADRIAALIAEKRKENELNMFRERLLQRQLQYKNQKSPDKVLDTSLESEAVLTCGTNTNVQPLDRNAIERSPPSTTHQAISASDHARFQLSAQIQQLYSKRAAGLARSTASLASAHEQVRTTIASRRVNTGSPGSLSPSRARSITGSLIRNESEPSLVKAPTSKSVAIGEKPQLSGVDSNRDASTQSPSGDTPYEANVSNIISQPTVFTNHITNRIPTRTLDSQASHNPHRDQAVERNGRLSNPVPTGKSYVSQRLSSSIPAYGQNTKEVTTASCPSPASLVSSYSPTGLSARQFSQINISAQPNHHASTQASLQVQNRPTTHGLTSLNDGAYYMVDRPTWASPDHQNGPFGLPHPAVQSQATSVSHHSYTSSAIAPAMQQQMNQPPLLTSNVNMFSGNARSNIGNGVGVTPQKPRVNMFSNTKGTPFPMHEVIRQIEMT